MFPCGAFVNVSKPVGPTSRAVVNQVAKLVRKSLKVGHTGTLDPFASGSVVVALGCATKLIQYLPEQKVYRARVLLGASTDTDDHTGRVLHVGSAASVLREDVESRLRAFVGDSVLQKPPLFSALRMGGERAYHLARGGRLALDDIPERPVRIHSCNLVDWPATESTVAEMGQNDSWFRAVEGSEQRDEASNSLFASHPAVRDLLQSGEVQEAVLDISCGRGTYIRSIARDLGNMLGVPACLIGLERRETDGFRLAEAVAMDALGSEDVLWRHAEPPDAVFTRSGLQAVELPAALQLPEDQAMHSGSRARPDQGRDSGSPKVIARTLERLWVSKKPPKSLTDPAASLRGPVPPPVLGLCDVRPPTGSLVRVYASVAGWEPTMWAERHRDALRAKVRRAVQDAVAAISRREATAMASQNPHTRQKRRIVAETLEGVVQEDDAIEEALAAAGSVADPIVDSRRGHEEVGRWTGVPPQRSTQRQFVGLARVAEECDSQGLAAITEADAAAEKEWLQHLFAACEDGLASCATEPLLCAEPVGRSSLTELVLLRPEAPLSVAANPDENALVRHLTRNVVRGMKRRASGAAQTVVSKAKRRVQASREEAKMRKRERMQRDKSERLARKERRERQIHREEGNGETER